MVIKCPTLSTDFVGQMSPLQNNRLLFLSSVIKLVYIRGMQRHQVILDPHGYEVHGMLKARLSSIDF